MGTQTTIEVTTIELSIVLVRYTVKWSIFVGLNQSLK